MPSSIYDSIREITRVLGDENINTLTGSYLLPQWLFVYVFMCKQSTYNDQLINSQMVTFSLDWDFNSQC